MSVSTLFQSIYLIFFALLGLSILIGFHELGHFFFCKLFNVRTPSFSIGFGPHIVSRKIGETLFSFSLIPFGGYVEIAGLEEVGQGEQQESKRVDERAFSSKPYYQKLLILLGGIFFNLIFSYTILTILFMQNFSSKFAFINIFIAEPIIETVIDNSPAAIGGLKSGDRIQAIDNKSIPSIGGPIFIRQELTCKAGQTINVEVLREGVSQKIPISLTNGNSLPLGVIWQTGTHKALSFISALKTAIHCTHFWITSTFHSLISMIRRRSAEGLGGPISILQTIAGGVQEHVISFFIILCFISVNLACLNIIPLPVFDGGQVLFVSLEALTGWTLDRIRLIIHYITWFFLLFAMLYLSWNDISRIFSRPTASSCPKERLTSSTEISSTASEESSGSPKSLESAATSNS